MGDNVTRQADEIEALSAIYPGEWKIEDESYRTYSVTVTEAKKTATLLITLPPEYPSESPPYYLLTAPWMNGDDMNHICTQLEDIYSSHIGESILHLWIEKLREYLVQKYANGTDDDVKIPDVKEPEFCNKVSENLTLTEECPLIFSTTPFTDKKSTFQGHAAEVHNTNQVKIVLAKLYENRKIVQATHNMYAYRIYNEETKNWLQDCEDDGENQAGGRLMHLLQILDVKNVVVVVSRWFGGILLGGDRFKHINNAARDALELGNFLSSSKETCATGDDHKKKKKKGK